MNAKRLGQKHVWILSALLCTYFPLSFAADYITPSNWYLAGDLGAVMPTLSNRNTAVANGSTTQPPLDIYSISKPNVAPILALEGGYRWTRNNPWFHNLTLGLRYQYTDLNTNGTIEQYSSVAHTNYNYKLNMATHALSVVGKLNIYQFKRFSPYVTLGLGQALAIVGGYSETPLGDVTLRTSPGYQSKFAMNTTYSAGAGIDYIFNHKWSMSLGYEYANLGTLKTTNGSGTWSNSSLSLGTLSSSALLLGVRYQLPE